MSNSIIHIAVINLNIIKVTILLFKVRSLFFATALTGRTVIHLAFFAQEEECNGNINKKHKLILEIIIDYWQIVIKINPLLSLSSKFDFATSSGAASCSWHCSDY